MADLVRFGLDLAAQVATVTGMSKIPMASAKLKQVREKRGLSVRAASGEVGCSHVAWINWEGGSVPLDAWQEILEQWSGGAVKASSWPLSPRAEAAKLRFARAQEAAAGAKA